jgi:hypothetical protein
MKKIYDRTLDEQIYDNRKKHDKANTVFLKLLAKQKSKRKNWSDVRAETYPAREIKPGVDDPNLNLPNDL